MRRLCPRPYSPGCQGLNVCDGGGGLSRCMFGDVGASRWAILMADTRAFSWLSTS
jgi:hypothetical protein